MAEQHITELVNDPTAGPCEQEFSIADTWYIDDYTSGDWNGALGNIAEFYSDTSGSSAILDISAFGDIYVSYVGFKDITISGGTVYCDTTCLDHGGNTGIIFNKTVTMSTGGTLELYVSPYFEIKAGGIPNFLDTDDMPTEWIRKCDGQDYSSERQLYRSLNTEAYNKFGVCMTYYVVSYDTQYDRIWGEDNNRRFVRKFEFMGFYPLVSEEKMWTKFAIQGIDEFSIFVSKDHFRVASTYGQSTVAGNVGEGTYPIYIPDRGDIVQAMFNRYLYEVTNVKEEAMMIHLNKRYVWELIVRPYTDEHLSLDSTTSASMGTVSAFINVKPDILDIRQSAIGLAGQIAYTPKSCERPSRDPWSGW